MARILIIDDDDQMRNMIRQILEDTGHEVLVAPDGRVGLDLFRQHPVDLIITDILMPEVDGLEIIQTLRRESPEIKIIAISGGGETGRLDYLPEAREFGAQHTFSKPFHHSELLEVVERLLGEGL